MMSMSCREEEERSDHRSGHLLSRGGATVGAILGFFGGAILFAPGYGITGYLVVYATMGVGAGVGGFIGYVLDDIWVYRQTPPRRWKRR